MITRLGALLALFSQLEKILLYLWLENGGCNWLKKKTHSCNKTLQRNTLNKEVLGFFFLLSHLLSKLFNVPLSK